MLDKRQFLDDVAKVSDGDYVTAFKMLGFVQYVTEAGADRFLSGALVWVETIHKAGWGALLSEVRFDQAISEYVTGLGGQPDDIRQNVLTKLDAALAA